MNLNNHIVFCRQFLQMCKDFEAIIHKDECPACGLQTRPNVICLNDECDWMLYIAPDTLHPATIPWIESLKGRLKGRLKE